MSRVSPDDIDALLPQTQCGLCGYGGCMPYAEAIIYEDAKINLCPPGGVQTLQALGNLLQQDISAYADDMLQKAKSASRVTIRETECIGCTKCIQVCPVDAIVGAAKLMHTVIADECNGCDLCIPACPVDCIDVVELIDPPQDKKNHYRSRYLQREARLKAIKKESAQMKLSEQRKKSYIADAIARVKSRKK